MPIRYKHINIIWLMVILLISLQLGAKAQEAEITPDLLALTPTATLTETATTLPSATPTLTPTGTPVPLLTEAPTPMTTAALTPETTVEATSEPTTETAMTPEVTATAEISITATASPTPTLTETLTVTPETTADPLLTPEITAAITPTHTPELLTVTGLAQYQSRQPDASGIQISIVDSSGITLNSVLTDTTGAYTTFVPADQPFFLVITAPLHQHFQAIMPPGAPLPPVILAGGDLNQDGCIGLTDISLLTAQFDTAAPDTDINGDGLTEAADLAILAGNFESGCETPPVTPTPEITATLTPETTPEVTLALELTTEAPPTLEPTAETPASTLTLEPTGLGSDLSPEPSFTPISTKSF